MWYLIAFVVCLDVALAKSPRCLCPKTEKLDPSVLDFIVTAEISYVVGRDEDGFQPYGIKNTRVIKPANSTLFNSRVYTNGEGEWFGVTLNPGTRFILEGVYEGGDPQRPMVTSCELLRQCEKVDLELTASN